MWLSPTTSHVPMHPISMIEKVSKKTIVKNVEHTKLWPNEQFTSIKPGARSYSKELAYHSSQA
jgi:hypothetical protein